jgi:hypothetical protein
MLGDRLCPAIVERRMGRFLWKVVQLPGHCRLVPTRRLTAAVFLTGRVGYPGALLEPIEKMVEQGVKLANRTPYEVPQHFYGSMYGLNATLSVAPCHYLLQQGLMELYEDRFGDPQLVEDQGLSVVDLEALYQGRVAHDLDVMDKMRGDAVEARVEVRGMPQRLAAVLEVATRSGGYPLCYDLEICQESLKKLARPAQAAVALERRLLEALPTHIVRFADLPALAKSPAASTLKGITRRILDGDAAVADPAGWVDPLMAARGEVARVGTPYAAIAVGEVTSLPEEPDIPLPGDCAPSPEVEAWLLNDPALRLHASVCSTRCRADRDDVDLLMLYSMKLWLESTNLSEMFRMFGGYASASADVICGRTPIH